jgi:hypothetical protein
MNSDDDHRTTSIDWHPMLLHMRLKCPVCHDRSEFRGVGALYIRCASCRSKFELPKDIPLTTVDLPTDADGVLDADTENVD